MKKGVDRMKKLIYNEIMKYRLHKSKKSNNNPGLCSTIMIFLRAVGRSLLPRIFFLKETAHGRIKD